ncbi:hypothetical protein WH47_09405 [Habropoda laboriosa]|uniref:CUB domain-containing protein n=1 Tax=Habropoda laboriosa TaxID=597456 RepID=A0A0L7RES0_9HYME|nr:PREDICTED: uncharacterized protein LOC108578885 [Habropoda laboriosa]KOC69447.1 hypothetical protein WH47_09405 [Habropoda laboriosa]
MARWNVLHFLCLLYLANNCVNYGSCMHDDHYVEYGLGTQKFCHVLGKTFTTDIKSGAAIVMSKHIFEQWMVRTNLHCKFTFKTAKGDGLFGVIQKMSFRRNKTQCLDYVQFKRKDHHQTEKFCGSIDRSKVKYYVVPEPEDSVYSSESPSLARTYAEYDPINHKSAAELETEIFISKEKLKEGEFLALSIAYTSFTNCSHVDREKYTSIGYQTCMLNEFFCDGIYNCAPGVCFDEDTCPNNTNAIISTGTGTKVTVGAVTTLILCFIIFMMCLWICKRSQKLCWSMDCADPNSRPWQVHASYMEGPATPVVPSAPMLEVAVPSSVADKDLPPSYDSLFPEQSNPVRS